MKILFLKSIASVLCCMLLFTGCNHTSKIQNAQAVSLKKDTIIAECISVSASEAPDEIIVFEPEGSTEESPDVKVPDEIIVFEPKSSADETIATIITDEYKNAQNNVIIESEVISADTGIDLSSVDKVYNYADVVLICTVNSIGISQYRGNSWFFPYSITTASLQQIFKGDADKEFSFSFAGGYVPASEYIQKKSKYKNGKSGLSTLSDSKIQNGYAHVKITKRPEFHVGQQYVVFLTRAKNGELITVGSDYSVLSVENGKYKDYNGKERVVAPRK